MMLSLALLSWGAYAQHDHGAHAAHKTSEQQMGPVFKDKKLGEAYGHYSHLKNDLVASNVAEAKKASAELVKSLTEVKDGHKAHSEATKVAIASSLNDQRKAFTALSNEMAELVKGNKLSEGQVYLTYCPMANSNKGGAWLSNDKEVRNPYFGDRMLKCGSVKETIQ